MSYPRAIPPEPSLTGDEARQLTRAYAQAEEAAAVASELDREPAGVNLTTEVNIVTAAIEALLNAIESTADDYGLRL